MDARQQDYAQQPGLQSPYTHYTDDRSSEDSPADHASAAAAAARYQQVKFDPEVRYRPSAPQFDASYRVNSSLPRVFSL